MAAPYKLRGEGIPGNASVRVQDLVTSDVPVWNGTTRKWDITNLGGGLLPVGTATHNTLRWDGAAWVETDGVTIDPASLVELKQAGTTRLRTTTLGVHVLGGEFDLNNSGAATTTNIRGRNSEGGMRIRIDGAAVAMFLTTNTGADVSRHLDFFPNGTTQAYWNNLLRIATVDLGIDITNATLGEATSLDVVASDTNQNAYIRARGDSGGMQLRWNESTTTARIQQTAASGNAEDDWITMLRNDAVRLFFNNVVKFTTTVDGVDVVGDVLDVDGDANANPTDLLLRNSEGGVLLRADGDIFALWQTESGGTPEKRWIDGLNNGATRLYYNDSRHVLTTADGMDVQNLGSAATLLDIFGSGATFDGILGVRGDSGGARFFWDEGNVRLRIQQTDATGALEDLWIEGLDNGEVRLYNNGVLTARTAASSWHVRAVATGNPATPDVALINMSWKSQDDLLYGSLAYNNSADFAWTNFARGGILHMAGQKAAGGFETLADFDPDGSADLYWTGSLKLSTTTDGADVLGTLLDVVNSGATATYLGVRNSEGGVRLQADGDNAAIRRTDSSGTNEQVWIEFIGNKVVMNFLGNARFESTNEGAQVVGVMGLGSATLHTIVDGAITVTASYCNVATESLASTDDLDTINFSGPVGAFIVVKANDSGDTVVCTDNTGNLRLNGNMDLDHAQDSLGLIWNGGVWHELFRSSNA